MEHVTNEDVSFEEWIRAFKDVTDIAGAGEVAAEVWRDDYDAGKTPLEAWLDEYPEDTPLFDGYLH